jgi:hypothetical protein
MDFITSIQEAQGFEAVLVIVDRFSKLVYMAPTRGTVTAYETAKLFLNAWWKHVGLLRINMLDWDPKFISASWRHFVREVGTKLTINIAFHLQIDGQIKWENGVLNQYLRNFVSMDQHD